MTQLQDWFYQYNGWSHAKHETWKQCKRRYFYQYIAPAVKNPVNLDVEKIKRLKQLTPKYALMGRLIHEVLEEEVHDHSMGIPVRKDEMLSSYLKKTRLYENTAQDMVVEFFNREKDETFFDLIRIRGTEQLETFNSVIWPYLKDQTYIQHEEFDKCTIRDIPVMLKVDLVTRIEDDRLVITDWKTGDDQVPGSTYRMQLGVYILWAEMFYHKSAGDIICQVAWLSSGRIERFHFTELELERIRDLIVKEYGEMNRTYDPVEYPENPGIQRCMSCAFRSVCQSG